MKKTALMSTIALWIIALAGLAEAQDRYAALDSARIAWNRTEGELPRIGGMPSKEAAKLLDRAEREWRNYASAKKAVYQVLAEEVGTGKDNMQSLGPGIDAEAVKASLLTRREKLQHGLTLLTSALRAAQSSAGPDAPLKSARLTDQIRLTRDAIAMLDSSYVRADQVAKGARAYRETRTELVTALGELVTIYREQIAAVDAEDAEMQREFKRLRTQRKPTVANQAPEEGGASERTRIWNGQGSKSRVRLMEHDGRVAFELDGVSFQCPVDRVMSATVRCSSKRSDSLSLTITADGIRIDVSWHSGEDATSRNAIMPGQAKLELAR